MSPSPAQVQNPLLFLSEGARTRSSRTTLPPEKPPNKNQRLNDFTDRGALADNEHSWMPLAGGEPFSQVPGHRAPVVRDENTVLVRRKRDKVRIFRPSQTGCLDIQDVDGRFT
jgi:hypothetical protein